MRVGLTAVALIVMYLASAGVGRSEETEETPGAAKAESTETLTRGDADTLSRPSEVSPRQSMQQRFDQSSPAVGQSLPDVTGYDIEGNPIKLSSLKGHYSVIVFGCLT